MTEGPPPSAASSSKTEPEGENTSQDQLPATTTTLPATSNANGAQYAGKTYWPTVWPPQQNGNASGSLQTTPMTQQISFLGGSNPYAGHLYQPHAFYATQATKSTQPKASSSSKATAQPKATPPRSPSPVDPATYKHWDDVVKKFLLKTKMTETLKGFESDMLVLNLEWEQKVIPGALKEMVSSLQAILDHMAGKAKPDVNAMEVDDELDITGRNDVDELNERKLTYVHLSNGAVPRSQSSINKSISEFLSRARARNDASNRGEFLLTLTEKKRKLAEALEGSLAGDEENAEQIGITSCARVDAKTIDRDKQMKYDIAKYGEGPLINTVKSVAVAPPLPASSEGIENPAAPKPPADLVEEDKGGKESHFATKPRGKRKLVDSDEDQPDVSSGKSSRNSKRKGNRKDKRKEKKEDNEEGIVEVDDDAEERALSAATAERHPGIDARLKNIEAHFAVRFVPTPPQTLLSRLVFLEDHIIKLEKEYPPWAALHFNQPNRGWPPPPRTTPIIVPPHLRAISTPAATPSGAPSSSQSSTAPSAAPISAPIADLNTGTSIASKPKKMRSSLHKAVLERMEVQKAMSEMGGKGG